MADARGPLPAWLAPLSWPLARVREGPAFYRDQHGDRPDYDVRTQAQVLRDSECTGVVYRDAPGTKRGWRHTSRAFWWTCASREATPPI